MDKSGSAFLLVGFALLLLDSVGPDMGIIHRAYAFSMSQFRSHLALLQGAEGAKPFRAIDRRSQLGSRPQPPDTNFLSSGPIIRPSHFGGFSGPAVIDD